MDISTHSVPDLATIVLSPVPAAEAAEAVSVDAVLDSLTATPPVDGSRPPLTQISLRSGGYLFVREAVGMAIRLAGVVFTMRIIGPAGYGIYAAAAAYVLFIATFAQMGTELYLIRLPQEAISRGLYNQAFTFLLVTSLTLTGASIGVTYLAAPWIHPAGVLLPLRVLLLSVPINVLWAPAQAAIERQFQYRRMGLLELGGDIALYATAVPLALLHAGAWSLVAGYFAWQSWLLFGSLAMSGLRPRWDWSGESVRSLARYGFSRSASNWFLRIGGLVNPIIVGGVAGATGVGYVAFALRLVDTIGFAQRGAIRVGMVSFSKVGDDEPHRLRYGLEEGSLLELLALAVPFGLFGVAAHWLIPDVFGHEWVPAIPVYTLVALAYVLSSAGFIQMTMLLSRGRNLVVACATALQMSLLAVASFAFVRWMGTDGYGVASLIALAELIYTDLMARRVVSFSYRRLIMFCVLLAPLVLFPLLPLPWGGLVAVPMIVGLLLPQVRSEERRLVALARVALKRAE